MTQRAGAKLRLSTSSEAGTFDLGRALGAALVPGMTVLLSGGLGAGKTVLVRGVGDALGVARVRSPSFTLVNEYRTSTFNFSVVHADLYRLEPGEAEDLGLEEYHEAPCVLLVEWPERWARKNLPERDVLSIFIEAKSENERLFDICSTGGLADLALQNLEEAIKNGDIDPGSGLQPALD